MKKDIIKNMLSESIQISKDVTSAVPLLRMIGQNELSIENYRGILEYTDEALRVQTKIGQIIVNGKKLEVISYTNDEMNIIGIIQGIHFHQGG